MSGGFDDNDPDLDAAEYVLGTLDPAERAAFVAKFAQDESVQRAVAAWEKRFSGLADRLTPVAPPPDLWPRIESALGTNLRQRPALSIVQGGGAAPDAAALRRSRDRWRTAALLSGAAAAALVLFVAGRMISSGPADIYVAAVNRGGDKPALIVRVDMKTGQVLVRPVAATAPAGRSLELWYIGTDKTPRSMGLVEPDPAHLTLPAEANRDSGTFAISVEPLGGSKTGGPTGPVVYAGQLVKE